MKTFLFQLFFFIFREEKDLRKNSTGFIGKMARFHLQDEDRTLCNLYIPVGKQNNPSEYIIQYKNPTSLHWDPSGIKKSQ